MGNGVVGTECQGLVDTSACAGLFVDTSASAGIANRSIRGLLRTIHFRL